MLQDSQVSLEALEHSLFNATPQSPGTGRALRWLGDPAGLRVLDIGGGTGPLSTWLACRGARPLCVDINGRRLLRGAGIAGRLCGSPPHFVCARSEELPVADASMDVVVSRSSLQYTHIPLVLAECLRVLRPGGALILSENLSSNPFLALFRGVRSLLGGRVRLGRYSSGPSGPIRRYITLAELESLKARLSESACSCHHYLLPLSSGLCNLLGHPQWLAPLNVLTASVDRLLGRIPGIGKLAWWGTLRGRKPGA